MGQDQEKPHRVPIELLEREPGRPILAMDFCFMKCAASPADVAVIRQSEGGPPAAGALPGGDEFATTLVVVDKDTGSVRAFGVRTKQVSDFLVQGVIDMMDRLHLRATTLMSDNEPTILKLKATIRDAREHPTTLQESHVRDSKSNGFIESSIRWWQVKARTIRCSVETLCGRRLTSDHCIWPWLVRWSALLVDRYRIRLDGQTSYQACFGARYAGEILPFAETVLFKMPASGRVGVGSIKIGKDDSGFQHGIWVGKHERSDDHVILIGQGWFRCRTVRGLDETKRASQELFDAARGLPWERQGQPGAQGGERPRRRSNGQAGFHFWACRAAAICCRGRGADISCVRGGAE